MFHPGIGDETKLWRDETILALGVPVALAKGDRLEIRPVGSNCSQQAWPNFETACLRVAGKKTMIREARLVTADRTP